MDIKTSNIERVTITCSPEKRQEAFEYIEANGFHTIRSGPKSNGDYTCDTRTFCIVAEKEVSNG